MLDQATKISMLSLMSAVVITAVLPASAQAAFAPQSAEQRMQTDDRSAVAPGDRTASDALAQKKRVEDLLKNKPVPQPISNKRFAELCSYASYPGKCTIQSVRKTVESIHQKSVGGGPGYEGYEVKFSYAGQVPQNNKLAEHGAAREHEFRLTNSWYPGPNYIAKYAIGPGKSFACILKVITKGACTPTVFNFPTIDSADYFEHGR